MWKPLKLQKMSLWAPVVCKRSTSLLEMTLLFEENLLNVHLYMVADLRHAVYKHVLRQKHNNSF